MKKLELDILANDKSWLEKQYLENKLSIREIALLCGTTDDSIKTRLRKFSIPIRGRREANIISARKKPKKYSKTESMIEKHENQRTGRYISCDFCEESFYVTRGRLDTARFCSYACYNLNRRNKNTQHQRWRDAPEYGEWRSLVYERDGWKCSICSSKEKINAHHIFYGKEFPEKRFDVGNGITLCEKHHIMLHKKPRSFAKELVKQTSNIGEHLVADNPEASIREILYARTTNKKRPERTMI